MFAKVSGSWRIRPRGDQYSITYFPPRQPEPLQFERHPDLLRIGNLGTFGAFRQAVDNCVAVMPRTHAFAFCAWLLGRLSRIYCSESFNVLIFARIMPR